MRDSISAGKRKPQSFLLLPVKPRVKRVVQPNIPLCPQLPPFFWGTCAFSPEALMAPGQHHFLTQSSICLVISGRSTLSFSATTIRAGIRIWGEVTGSRCSRRRKKCPLLTFHPPGQGDMLHFHAMWFPPLTAPEEDHQQSQCGPGFVSGTLCLTEALLLLEIHKDDVR